MGRITLTQERLKELKHYNPDTGVWTHLTNAGPAKKGERAGSSDKDGYTRICVDYKEYRSARLAFFYMNGEWPRGKVDHRDLDKTNDRWNNLRHASTSQNGANTTLRSDNKSGIKGVFYRRDLGKYRAAIQVNGKSIYLGLRNTKEEASALYAEAAKQHFGEFARP